MDHLIVNLTRGLKVVILGLFLILGLSCNEEANVSVAVEPEKNGKLVYAHIAESAQGNSDGAKLAPKLLITNNGNSPVTLLIDILSVLYVVRL